MPDSKPKGSVPWWRRPVGGGTLGGAMVGLEQKMWRDQPPPNEVVESHSRRDPSVAAGDGRRFVVTIPDGDAVTPEQPPSFDPRDTKQTYDRVARHYADEIAGELASKPFDREFLDRFADSVGDGRMVELGCGPGHVSGYLASRGANVAGLDLSPAMVAEAGRLFPELDFQVGSMLALPFEDDSLAGVVSFYSIVHFDEPQTEQAFREMARVLRPGGLAAIAFHIGTDILHRDEWFGEEISVDFSFHEPETVSRQLAAAGLGIRELTEREPYPPPIEFQSRRCYLVAARGDLTL